MIILITGGAGFIGRTLQEELYKKDNKIVILDIKNPFCVNSELVTYVQGDVCDKKKMKSIFDEYQFDGIVHLAAVSRVVDAQNNMEQCERINIGGTQSLLNAVQISGQKPWLIFGSSREVYGESISFPVSECNPKFAVNIYAETKIRGESLFREFANKYEVSCAVIRFSNVYGNRYDIFDRVIPRFIRSIAEGRPLYIEGGDQVIDFTHINDTINGILNIINYINQNYGVKEDFHLSPGVGWSLYQLIEYIEKASNAKAKINVNPKRHYDVVRFIGDVSKREKLLGIYDFISLEDGISQCIDEYTYDISWRLS